MAKFSFSGHEKFHCRQFWLKKGYDFLCAGRHFTDDDAVVALGVGKNMVNSIRFWLKAFDLVDEREQPNEFARFIFGEQGCDPYLEDEGTLWLLQYRLVSQANASIYALFFNEFRKERIEFTKEHLLSFLKRKCDAQNLTVSEQTLSADIDVLIKTYLRPASKSRSIEDDFFGLLIDFALLQEVSSSHVAWYAVESSERETLPVEIFLYAVLDHASGQSISFRDLLNGENSVGLAFAMNESGVMKKIQDALAMFPSQLVFSDDAGIREFQFKEPLEKNALLRRYYEN